MRCTGHCCPQEQGSERGSQGVWRSGEAGDKPVPESFGSSVFWSGIAESFFAFKVCVEVLGTAALDYYHLQGVLRSGQAGDTLVPVSFISSVFWPHVLRHWRVLSGEEEEWEAAG